MVHISCSSHQCFEYVSLTDRYHCIFFFYAWLKRLKQTLIFKVSTCFLNKLLNGGSYSPVKIYSSASVILSQGVRSELPGKE